MRSEHTGYVVPDIPVQASMHLNTKLLCVCALELCGIDDGNARKQLSIDKIYTITNSDRTNCSHSYQSIMEWEKFTLNDRSLFTLWNHNKTEIGQTGYQ